MPEDKLQQINETLTEIQKTMGERIAAVEADSKSTTEEKDALKAKFEAAGAKAELR